VIEGTFYEAREQTAIDFSSLFLTFNKTFFFIVKDDTVFGVLPLN